MVLIFGFGPGQAEDLGEVAPATCPNCHNDVFLHHIRSKKAIRLYFVPVVPYGTDEYLLCPICHNGMQLQAAQKQAVEAMRASTSSYRRGHIAPNIYATEVEQFWRKIGVAPSGAQIVRAAPPGSARPAPVPPAAALAPPSPAPSATPPAAAPSPSPTTLPGQLAQLDRLHSDGILTDEEFAAAKERLLRS